MEKISTPEKSDLEVLKGYISNSKEEIENEYNSTTNSWIRCFGTMMAAIGVFLALDSVKEGLSKEELNEAKRKQKLLAEKFNELNPLYPTHESVVPDEIKEELIASLDVFK